VEGYFLIVVSNFVTNVIIGVKVVFQQQTPVTTVGGDCYRTIIGINIYILIGAMAIAPYD